MGFPNPEPNAAEKAPIGPFLVFGSGMQVFGSALAVLGVVWGLGKIKTLNQIFGNAKENLSNIYFVWIRWVVPATLLVILLSYIYTSIF